MSGGGVTPSPTPYVDLALPSGLLWRRRNVGAIAPEDPGNYFSWGNVEGHAEGSGYDFSQEAYDSTPAAAISTNLSLSQDAARHNLGSPWRIPTIAEFQELYDNCNWLWTTLNGVNGILFTSNVNGNKLFLPAAGDYSGTTLNGRGTVGIYWSSSYVSSSQAHALFTDSGGVSLDRTSGRRLGFTVRAVMEPM